MGANLDVMARDAKRMRGERPFVFTNLHTGEGVDQIVDFIVKQGLLDEVRTQRASGVTNAVNRNSATHSNADKQASAYDIKNIGVVT